MGTGEILSTGSVTNLVGLIEKCNFPQDAFLLAEQLPPHIIEHEQRQGLLRFARLGDVEMEAIQDFTSGRIFSEICELRWGKESGGDYQVVYFGPDLEIEGLSRNEEESKNVGRYVQEERRYYLFGERLEARQLASMEVEAVQEGNDYYATVRIPRLLSYPFSSGARRVQLVVREYLDETTGRARLFRFQKLEDASEKGGEAKA